MSCNCTANMGKAAIFHHRGHDQPQRDGSPGQKAGRKPLFGNYHPKLDQGPVSKPKARAKIGSGRIRITRRQPAVINGFSDLILELYGPEAGGHARSAVGMAELPFNIPVEIEAEVQLA